MAWGKKTTYKTNFVSMGDKGNGLVYGTKKLVIKVDPATWTTGVLSRELSGTWQHEQVDQVGAGGTLSFTLLRPDSDGKDYIPYPSGKYRLRIKWGKPKGTIGGITDEFVIA